MLIMIWSHELSRVARKRKIHFSLYTSPSARNTPIIKITLLFRLLAGMYYQWNERSCLFFDVIHMCNTHCVWFFFFKFNDFLIHYIRNGNLVLVDDKSEVFVFVYAINFNTIDKKGYHQPSTLYNLICIFLIVSLTTAGVS